MKLNPQIFREYDIRGTVDKDLSPEVAYTVGRAYGALCREQQQKLVAVGRDCRLTSPAYAEALARGIADEGVDVHLTGMGPTPQLYFSIFSRHYGGGIQVTGSHNPPDMNGFKICLGTQTLSGEQIQELKARCEHAQRNPATTVAKGSVVERPIRDEYIAYLTANSLPAMGKRKLRVVVDAGNGVGGLVGPAVLRNLGVEVLSLYCEPDGRFPNHHPDPAELKNLKSLIAEVKRSKADCGIAWDGDADRIGVIDERGEVIFGDLLLLIYARQVLKEEPGATIIGDVKCSSRLFSDVTARGGKAIMWKTGHSLIKAKLRESGGAIAGEMSGHMFFKHRFFGFDDAIYAASRFVEILSNTLEPVSSFLADLPPTVSTPEIRVDCPEEIKFKIAEQAKSLFPEGSIDTTDGARITFAHGWGLVRASNTQPVLVLRFEAESQKYLEEYQSLVVSRIEALKAA